MRALWLLLVTPLVGAAGQKQCSGGGATGLDGAAGYMVSWSTSIDADRLRLMGAAVVRAPAAWFRQSGRPRVTVSPIDAGGGGTIGPAMITFNTPTRIYWVDTVAVPMGYDNVLFLDVVRDSLRVVGTSFVDPTFPSTWSCDASMASVDSSLTFRHAIELVLRRSPAVGEFLRGNNVLPPPTVAPPRLLYRDLSGSWELTLDNPSRTIPIQFAIISAPQTAGAEAFFGGNGVSAEFVSPDTVVLRTPDWAFIAGAADDSLKGHWISRTGGGKGIGLLRRVPDPAPPTPTKPLPPVREINRRMAVTADSFRGRPEAVVLSDRGVMIADWARRRLALYDPTLAESITIFDSATPPPLRFPLVPPRMFLGAGDTVYMTDIPNAGMRVISPSLEVVRRQTVGTAEDLTRIANLYSGAQFVGDRLFLTKTLVQRVPGNFSPEPRDSLLLVRVNLQTARHDTLGYIDMKRSSVSIPFDTVPGRPRRTSLLMSPFDVGDAMAMSSFGELAVIRANDFHVDWLRADGTWRSTAPAQWTWKRLDDSARAAIRAEREQQYNAGRVQVLQNVNAAPQRLVMSAGRVPDWEPAFVPMSAIADRKGLIWVQLGARSVGTVAGPPTYAAIDSTGQIVDRISLPPGRMLIGFDKVGRIYAATPNPTRIELYRP